MTQIEAAEDNTKYKDGVNRNARLIVRNISFKATEDDLRNHFTPYGTVEEVKLLKNGQGKLVGCGFVHFTQVPMANTALSATNKKPFLGRPINVAWAVSKDKYVQQQTGPKKFSSGIFPESKDPEETNESKTPMDKDSQNNTNKPRLNRNARLVIRNVSFKATEESLKEHFQTYGELLEVNLLKKPDGKLVGCAFILYKNVPMAKKALLSTNMKPFLGRPISVDWAVAKNKYMQHVVEQQTQIQEKVKKEEDSDDDDDEKPPINITGDDLKKEVKSESDDDDSIKSEGDESDAKSDQSDAESDESDADDSESDDDADDKDDLNVSDTESQTPIRKRIQLNDAEDGCTVFVTNLPFEVDNDKLLQFAETSGPVKYALVCLDKLTEHSKGSGFVKFANKEDADRFLALPKEQLKLEGQLLQVKPALKRENLQKTALNQPKDNRNLYLVKEGVIVAGTKAAVGVSASDMAKRLALERSKTQMLKNLNRFVSRYRLVISNLPHHFDDKKLRALCTKSAPGGAVVTECRIMRDLRAPTLSDGTHPSKGYGFVMFKRTEDAISCLRKLNNNPEVFDKNNRPIVSFSIEDRTALNARKKRLEKSIANNPQANNSQANNDAWAKSHPQANNDFRDNNKPWEKNNQGNNKPWAKNNQQANNPQANNNFRDNNKPWARNNQGNNKPWAKNNQQANNPQANNNRNNSQVSGNQRMNRKRKNEMPDESSNKRKRDRKQNGGGEHPAGKFVKTPENFDEYTGLTAKEGSDHKMRSNHKLRKQADVHRQTVKAEKKTSMRSLKLKMAAKERVKQPKQKINKKPQGKQFNEKKVVAVVKKSNNFTDLVSKYKSKIAGNDLVKSKWYDN